MSHLNINNKWLSVAINKSAAKNTYAIIDQEKDIN